MGLQTLLQAIAVRLAALLFFAGEDGVKQLYDEHCAICHAVDGSGSGRGASLRGRLKYGTKRDTLIRIIRGGIPKTLMPSSELPARDIDRLAGYVLKLNARGKERK